MNSLYKRLTSFFITFFLFADIKERLMPKILDPYLYNRAKKIADDKFEKPSAYKSGYIVKTYKELGGRYKSDNKPRNLKRWFQEKWTDIGNKKYPVFRPTRRINKNTPLTVKEIDRKNLTKQINKKQRIQGYKNLPPFLKKQK
jgi:Family of unknown function (DUF5872)